MHPAELPYEPRNTPMCCCSTSYMQACSVSQQAAWTLLLLHWRCGLTNSSRYSVRKKERDILPLGLSISHQWQPASIRLSRGLRIAAECMMLSKMVESRRAEVSVSRCRPGGCTLQRPGLQCVPCT